MPRTSLMMRLATLCSSLLEIQMRMQPMIASPYGSWTSPITSDLVVAEAIRLEQVALDGNAIYWTESQPQKQGRSFVYRANPGGEPDAVTPDDANAFNVRTRVHEYGGGAFAVQDGTVYFSNFADQRLYHQDSGPAPRPITPAAAAGAAPPPATRAHPPARRRPSLPPHPTPPA